MRVAVAGCVHGNLRQVYSAIERSQQKPHLVVLCGDVQACRTRADLDSMSVPTKYRRMGDFHEYYSRRLRAPYLTILVGGNHEASAYMAQFPNGGWLAPRIWYLGPCGVVDVGGLTVGGLSGIWYAEDYEKPHFEFEQFARGVPPRESIYSVYHTRKTDVDALMRLAPRSVDLMVSHDWPQGIAQHGDLAALLAKKPWFRADIESGRLGNPAARALLEHLQPKWWVSAHLHVYFTAQFGGTRFVALDKVLPRRQFLEFIEVGPPATGSIKLRRVRLPQPGTPTGADAPTES